MRQVLKSTILMFTIPPWKNTTSNYWQIKELNMLNLMKMELCRIFKSKYSYFIILAAILTFLMTVGLVDYTTKKMDNIDQTIEETSNDNTNGVKVEIETSQIETLNDSGEDFVISSFSQSTYLVFLIIFGSLFFTNPYSNGFVKNFIGMNKNKESYIIASFIAATLFVIVSFAISGVILTLAGPHINNGMLKFTDYPRLVKILLVELISHISYLAVILLVATASRSTSKTLMFTLLYPTILFKLFIGLADQLMSMFKNLSDDFTLSDFVNIGNIASTNFNSTNADLVRSIIVAIIIAGISLCMSSVIINKKDI